MKNTITINCKDSQESMAYILSAFNIISKHLKLTPFETCKMVKDQQLKEIEEYNKLFRKKVEIIVFKKQN